ncbi:MAG TPA: hypothetical protein VGM64_19125 [Lacunisphaera sp.]|jgi:hypothetical protein
MSASPASRRAIAEIDFGDGANVSFKVGNRSIHQFWHLFSSHFRHVFLAPQRRADSGKVAWTWREAGEKRPVTATELAEVKRRLSEANRSLSGGFGGMGRRDDDEASSLEGQVRASVGEMVDQLLAQRDSALSGFVCRTDAGLMLHSWGAAVAAQPYFPDAQHGEISGMVFAGIEHLAGVTVVLENTQGIGGARAKSDKDGGFHFPNVAPGSYHLRVADRSDFPGGLTVEVERESITGLELRSISDEPLSMAGSIAPMTEDVPWFRRRSASVILLLLVLGAGIIAWWWSRRSSDAPVVAQNQSSSWQSAKGQLAANNSQPSASDDHKVGQEGAFSALSNSIPPPKVLHPRHDRTPSEADGMASDHAPQPPEDSAVPGQRDPEEKLAADKAGGKPAPRTDEPPVHATREPLNSSSGGSEEKMGTPEDEPGAVPEGDDVKAAKDKLAKSPRRAAAKKKAGTPGASAAASDESPDEDEAPAGTNAAADAAASSTPAAKGGKSSPRGGAKSPTASGAAANAEAADSNANAGASDSLTPGAGAGANGQLKPSQGKKARESAKGATAAGAAAVSADSAGPGSAGDTSDGSPSPEAGANKSAAKSPASKKTPPANQAATQADSSPPPDQAAAESPPAPSPTASSSKPAKRPSSTVAGKSVAAAPANESPASATEADADQPIEAQSSGPAGNLPSRKRPEAKKKSTSNESPQGDEADSPAETKPSPNLSATISAAAPAVTFAPKDEVPLVQIEKIHASAWKQRMLRDVIVPTRPVTAAEEEAMDTLRENLRREEATRLPKAFRQPRMSGGLVIEFTAIPTQPNPPHWRDESGAEPTGSSVSGQRAELMWSDGVPPLNTTYTLSDADGRVIAVASVDGHGAVALKTTAKSNAWYWCGIERTPTRSADAGAGDTGAPFDWKLLSGAAIPASWTRDDHWLDGRGQRLDIPLDATTKRVGNYQVALIDPVTGWAIVSDLGLQAP